MCIMAYGQTGSGKTFTMMGPKDNPGVNVRAIRELLKICSERDQVDYTLKVSPCIETPTLHAVFGGRSPALSPFFYCN